MRHIDVCLNVKFEVVFGTEMNRLNLGRRTHEKLAMLYVQRQITVKISER